MDGCKEGMGRNRRTTRQEEQNLKISGERMGLMDGGKEFCRCARACARVRASLCAFVFGKHWKHSTDLLRLKLLRLHRKESCMHAYVCTQVCACLLVEITGITVLEFLRLHKRQSLSEICKSFCVILHFSFSLATNQKSRRMPGRLIRKETSLEIRGQDAQPEVKVALSRVDS